MVTSVSNFDRIFAEIKKQAHAVASEYGSDPNSLVRLAIEIVDLEDRNQTKAVARVAKRVEEMIYDAAVSDAQRSQA